MTTIGPIRGGTTTLNYGSYDLVSNCHSDILEGDTNLGI